jgi:uncharacterized protein YwlG (UPF0340 family)
MVSSATSYIFIIVPQKNYHLVVSTAIAGQRVFAKRSSQIASALYDGLVKTNLTNKKTVHLIVHGCGGQNKNSSHCNVLPTANVCTKTH